VQDRLEKNGRQAADILLLAEIRIPDDVAIIGTGDHSFTSYLGSSLSSFNRLQYNLHVEAGRLLPGHLSGEITTPTHMLNLVSPVLRESTKRGQLANL
jgi:DNA-binding LacI/PurR family transcriptional regulator